MLGMFLRAGSALTIPALTSMHAQCAVVLLAMDGVMQLPSDSPARTASGVWSDQAMMAIGIVKNALSMSMHDCLHSA